jgi:hypothetical protein
MVRDLECKLERGVMKMAKLRKMLTHPRKGESGQGALAIVVILLMLGAIILTPLLVFMSTGLKAGGVYESKVQEFYAADAGVEDGLWQIKNDKLSTLFYSYPYDPYNYTANYSYSVAPNASGHEINAKNVTVNIANVWIPSNIPTPNPAVARSIIENGTLIVTGSVINFTGGRWGCQIKISYSWRGDDPNGTNLKIATIGAWISGGCNYTSGSGNLSSYTPTCVPYCGGQAITWNLNSQTFKLSGQTSYPLVRTFNFNFTGPESPNPQALSWITTTDVPAIPYSWDADSKPYRIGSTAGSTTTEAYTIKNEMRKLGSTISGDYVAIGNTLMMPDPNNNPSDPNQDYRSRLLKESSATIQSSSPSGSGYIPPGATIEAAYLYWSGWIDHYYWKATTRYGHTTWSWSADPTDWGVPQDNWTGLVYDASNLQQMVEGWADGSGKGAKVNTVNFNGIDITTHDWQVWPKTNDAPACWYYTCFYDATSIVKPLIESDVSTFTLGHASNGTTSVINQLRPGDSSASHTYSFTLCDSNGNPTSSYTGYPLGTSAHKLPSGGSYDGRYHASYAGWSLVIIYSSPDTQGHQLYLYDIKSPGFTFQESFPGGASQSDPDFDGDGNPGGKISGFLVPQQVGSETNAAKITCFVGEGDEGKTGDSFKVTGPSGSWANLPDGTGAALNDVWNSESVGLAVPGVDIDTFYVTWSSNIVRAGDTWAQVDLPTTGDGFTLSYIILSFRSSVTTGGAISYLIR